MQARHISRKLTFAQPYLMTLFDADKLEIILGNLFVYLSNKLNEHEEISLHVRIDSVPAKLEAGLVLTFPFGDNYAVLESFQHSYRMAAHTEELFGQSEPLNLGIMLTFNLLKLLKGAVDFSGPSEPPSVFIRIPIQRSPLSRVGISERKSDDLLTQILPESDGLPDQSLTTTESAGADVQANRPTLLLADRSKDLAQFLKRHFQTTYHVVVTHSFEETLKKAGMTMPDLVLCDNDLRDRQHRSLCEVLKQQPITQAIPVLLLLNDDEDETILEGLGCGADGYISKPFNVKELDLLIRNNLRAVVTLKDKLAGIQATTGLTALPRRNKEQEFVLKFAAFVNEQYGDQHLTIGQPCKPVASCSTSC